MVAAHSISDLLALLALTASRRSFSSSTTRVVGTAPSP